MLFLQKQKLRLELKWKKKKCSKLRDIGRSSDEDGPAKDSSKGCGCTSARLFKL